MTSGVASPQPLPAHIEELADQAYDGNYDFNRRAFSIALWFVGHDMSEDAYVDFMSSSGLAVGYKRNDLGKRLRKTYQDAEDKYDPALAGGRTAPGFADEMIELLNAVECGYTRRNKAHVLALIQHALNTGHNPVHASARQLAAISGRALPVTAKAMSRISSSVCGCGVVSQVTFDGEYGHSRLWHLNSAWRPQKGYICTCKYISNPSETSFVNYVQPLPAGTEVTVALIASELNITRPAARKLLDKYLDRYFGGGYFEGDRRTRTPARWWRSRADGHHHDYRGAW
jgi:hypothetical protein